MTLSKKEKSVTGRKSLYDLLVTVSQFRKYSGKMPTEHFDSMQVRYKIGFPPLHAFLDLFPSTSTAIWLRILDDHKQKPLLNVFNHLMVSWIRNIIRDCSHKVI